MKKILLAGTIAFDEITTPFGHSGRIPGGSAVYAALAASLFRNKTGMISVAGGDFPSVYLQMLEDRGLSLNGVQIFPNEKTFYWKGFYYDDMNRRDTLVTRENVLRKFRPVVPDGFKNADIVILGNLHPGIQTEILDQLTDRPELVMLDTMNYWMETAPRLLRQVIERVDLLLVNEEEARQLTGKTHPLHAAADILEMGPRYVIVKQGEYGAALFGEEGVFYTPAYPLEILRDPTGAGDTFAGAFAGHLSEYDAVGFEEMKNALVCGANTASFTVEDFGTRRLEQITREDLETRMREFIDMTRFPLQEKYKSV
ncbi:MAG: sugar kinase [Chlorobi bacterium]|nr:sugar kinase [Chlorobiota bacterium]